MKKLLFILFAFVTLSASAQTGSGFLYSNSIKAAAQTPYDSTTNVQTKTQFIKILSPWETIVIQGTFERLTGTAGGTATLWVSGDGVNYGRLDTNDVVLTNVATQTNTPMVEWVIPYGSPWNYYMVSYTAGASSTMRFKSQAFWKK